MKIIRLGQTLCDGSGLPPIPIPSTNLELFLRHNFNIPTAKFDWGHPNIRDPGLQDYINQNESSFARECQVGFFPEYFQILF